MGTTDTSAVQITINVVDGSSGAVVSQVAKNLDKLGEAGARNGQRVAAGMRDIGSAGAAGGQQAAAGMKAIGDHALTSLDNVRLLRDDLGIRIPRSMEKAIASSRLLSTAIAGIGSGLLIGGAIEIGVRLGEQAYDLYEKWLDVTKAVKDYTSKAAEAAQQKLFSEGSFDTTRAFLRQASAQMDELQAKKKAWDKTSTVDAFFLPHSSAPRFTTDDDKHLATSMGVVDQENLRNLQQSHEMMLKNIDDQEKLRKSSATAAGAIALERRAAHQRDQENLSFAKASEQIQADIYNRAHKQDPKKYPGTYTPDKEAGQQEFYAAENSADIGANSASAELGLKQEQELMQLRRQADSVGLAGERQLAAQRIAAIEDLDFKYKHQTAKNLQYAAELAEVNRRFDNEEMQRLHEQTDEVRRKNAEAGQHGLTGLAAIDARSSFEKSNVDADLKAGKFYGNRDEQAAHATALKGSIDAGASADAAKEQESFADRLSQMDAGRSERYASEDDRITESARKTVAEITKAWTEMYGGLGVLDARRVQAQQALNDEIAKINLDAARQRQEAGQRVEDDTRKLEDQARREGLPKYQQETAAIVDEYNERFSKLEELRVKDSANAERYRRQEIAEEQIKNGKLLEQRRQLEDQLASRLHGLIGSHPLDFLKSQGEDQADKFASQAMFHYLPNFSTALAGGKNGGGLPNIFGSGWGGKHPAHVDVGASEGSGTKNDNPSFSSLSKSQIAAASTTLNATNAVINIQSASFGGRGGGVAHTSSGTYVATGNGGAFNIGGGSVGGGSGDAGLPVGSGSSGGGSVPSTPDLGGGGIADKIGGGVSAAQADAQTIHDIGHSTGLDDSDKGGNTAMSGDSKDGSSGDSFGSKLGGEAGAALGLFAAAEGKGGFGGALSGAASGAKLGAMIAGPMGAAIGAIGGAALGLMGFGARAQAEKYNDRQVKPRIANDLIAFESGQSDYQSMFDDLTHLVTEAKVQTRQMGPAALSYYNSTIDPEIKAAQSRMTREQKAGRSQFGMTAAQFHNGGMIRDFGSMATGPDTGWIHAQRNEVMLNQQAAMSHSDAAMLMNAGASRADMAAYYGGGSGVATAQPSGGDLHLHVHAIDTKGVTQFFQDNKHTMRAQLNASYDENSGGGDFA